MEPHRPISRAARHSAIEEALSKYIVTSQQQLSSILSNEGIEVTQATLSRDLDELKAVKTRRKDGKIAYSVGETSVGEIRVDANKPSDSILVSRALTGLVTSVASAGNLVVVHTLSGAAQYMGSLFDRNPFEGVLGTIAGDDTVLIVVSDGKTAEKLTKLLLDAASKKADVSSESAESADSANFAESDKSAESRKSVADGKNRENREYFVKTEKT
ncbi:MAG: arginine repressor [Bifidobacteriaceae bacterium]|nr:arginine repressor [Bifidobacteriaceae bacterium]